MCVGPVSHTSTGPAHARFGAHSRADTSHEPIIEFAVLVFCPGSARSVGSGSDENDS